MVRRLPVRAVRLGDPVQLFLAANLRATAAYRAGDIDEMDRCLEIMRSTVETLDQPLLTWVFTFTSATRAQIAGDTDRAEQLAAKALQIGTEGGEPDAAVIFGGQAVIVSLQRGTLAELVPFITQAATDNPGFPAFVAALAMAYGEGDRLDEARRLLEEFAATDFDLPRDPAWLTGMIAYSDAAIECRDPRYAGPLLHLLSPWADEWSTTSGPTAEGPVSYSLGGLATVLGRYDEADAYFAQSAISSARAQAKFFSARTHLLWGKMLAERRGPGDVDKARELLTTAHTSQSPMATERSSAARRTHFKCWTPDEGSTTGITTFSARNVTSDHANRRLPSGTSLAPRTIPMVPFSHAQVRRYQGYPKSARVSAHPGRSDLPP